MAIAFDPYDTHPEIVWNDVVSVHQRFATGGMAWRAPE
jgi:hypothetical protein